MTAEKRSILQPSEKLKEFQAATCESTDANASSARITRHSEVKVRVWISTDKRASRQRLTSRRQADFWITSGLPALRAEFPATRLGQRLHSRGQSSG
jgi:hypothetical protein